MDYSVLLFMPSKGAEEKSSAPFLFKVHYPGL